VPLAELERIRSQMGEAAFASQYMQRPAPAGGGLVKIEWFKRYAGLELPAFDRIVQSWDTANKTSQWNDFSVCTTWGVEEKRAYLLHVFRERKIYPDLKASVIQQARLHQPSVVLIEDNASGTQLLQELGREGGLPLQAVKPSRDKQMRMASQTSPIANGFIYLPQEAHWLSDYLHEFAVFPNGRHDDQIDSTSQALDWIYNPQMKGWNMFELTRREAEAMGFSNARTVTYQPGSVEWAQAQREAKGAG
jgi:predicted phage terminase large subunit-like protein